jgi:hypothetical protein
MWLFLAMPAVWLAWSLIFFCASLLSFIWRSGDRRALALTPFTDETAEYLPMSFNHFAPLWPRITQTAIFSIGLGMGPMVVIVFGQSSDPKRNDVDSSESPT